MEWDQAAQETTNNFIKISLLFFSFFTFICIVVFVTIQVLNLSLFTVSGTSMEPTMHDNGYILLKKEKNIEDNHIVFFNKPDTWDEYYDKKTVFTKRILAKPGDKIYYDGKKLFVNNQEKYDFVSNDYDCSQKIKNYSHILDDNEFFAAGDNSKNSLDSRYVFCQGKIEEAYVPKDNIVAQGLLWKSFKPPSLLKMF